MHNRGPQGPHDRSYFKCIDKKCPAKLSTLGPLDGELTLSYHHHEDHNHRADISSNIVAETMSEFRQEISSNPDVKAKRLFEELATRALELVEGTPSKLDVAKKLPTYRSGKL